MPQRREGRRLSAWKRVKYNDMSLNNRVRKLEKNCQNRLKRTEDYQNAEHDGLTGDHLLRLWENSDDWVRERTEMVIGKCEGISTEARVRLQERLTILQTGSFEEIFLVIAGLCRDAPGWSSLREGEVLAAVLKVNPAMSKAVAECGILRAGKKDWRAFAAWLERRATRDFGRDRVLAEDPRIPGAIFGLAAPDVSSATDEPSPTCDLPP
jgi:hypothetical protein